MLRKKISALFITGICLSSAVQAKDIYRADSLVGIEGGYTSLDYKHGTNSVSTTERSNLGNAGIKLGAENKDYRIFLSGRYFYDASRDFEYIMTLGAEVQYKFNVLESMNIFIGVNGGISYLELRPADGTDRTMSEPYVGGDIGTNIHLGDSTDLELGFRIMSIQAKHTLVGYEEYTVGNLSSAYASIIFKWQMD
jgi:hypothetical protein